MSHTPDRALVLTAGRGRRLRPLSDVRAKAAVPIAGETLIRRILRWLAGHNIRDIVLNLHHRADTITRVVGDGSDLAVRVRYSWEQPLLGSAGGPRRALPFLAADRFFILNGDTLTDVDLAALAADHERSGALVTMALIPNPEPAKYGGVVIDGAGAVIAFTRAGDPDPSYHFIGAQVVERAAFEDLADGVPVESVTGTYRSMIGPQGKIRGLVSQAAFQDVGTPADYLRTCLEVAAAEHKPSTAIGARARIAPSARLTRTVVWEDVEVGARAELIDCVVADGVVIPPSARFAGSALVPAAGRQPEAGQTLEGNLIVAPLQPGSAPEGGAART